jgi:uncharacterized repeat protein (TIGR01451 family)
MAGPHVAGLVSLLISANPSLAGNVDALEELINASALTRTSAQTCDDIPGTDIPNPIYGWGRIDALAAVELIQFHELELSKSVSAAAIEPGGMLTYTLSITHTHTTSPTLNVVLTDALPANTTFVTTNTTALQTVSCVEFPAGRGEH